MRLRTSNNSIPKNVFTDYVTLDKTCHRPVTLKMKDVGMSVFMLVIWKMVEEASGINHM